MLMHARRHFGEFRDLSGGVMPARFFAGHSAEYFAEMPPRPQQGADFEVTTTAAGGADLPANPSTTASVTVGDTFTGTLETNGDRDWIRVELVAGESYLFNLQGTGGALNDTYLRLYDGAGNLVGENDDAQGYYLNSRLGFVAATSGTYYLEAAAFNDAASGDFSLQTASLGAGDVREDVLTTATIVPGGSYSGELEAPSDRDWIRVELQAGTSYVFSFVGDDSTADLRVFDASGMLVSGPSLYGLAANFYSSEHQRVGFEASSTGVYYVEVSHNDGADNTLGAYTLTAVEAPSADLPENVSTPVELSFGYSVENALEFAGDRDWISVELEAGSLYEFTVTGAGALPLDHPLLRLFNETAGIAVGDNEGGEGDTSTLRFFVEQSGTYYIEVAAAFTQVESLGSFRGERYGDAETGGYSLTVEQIVLPVFSIDDIADYLTTGFWEDTATVPHAFDAWGGDIITVNTSGLTSEGRELARAAFDLWSDATGLIFQETNGAAQISFDDDQAGAWSTTSYGGDGITVNSHVNVSLDWLSGYGTALNTYSFTTYIHEIGHALGLGHAGPYNESAQFASHALYENDSTSVSIMSYFDPALNPYDDSTFMFDLTPQMADLEAIRTLYGGRSRAHRGDTVYGLNSDAGSPIYGEAFILAGKVMIFDSSGTDTLDLSFYIGDQLIDLRPGAASNVGGNIGSLTISSDTIIEHAVGGDGNETFIGNDVRNELYGGGGNDTLYGGGGFDALFGGAGDDVLNGGTDGDLLLGGAGDDLLHGDDGNDAAGGGDGDDTMYGDAGNDRFWGDNGDDTLFGGVGADFLAGGEGDDVIDGGDGADQLRGAVGDDLLSGGAGNDILDGHGGNDVLSGGAGNDTLRGRADADTLSGGAGNDVLNGDAGNDWIEGGDGADTLDGGLGNDIIFGGAGADNANGASGNDRFIGGAGDDRFRGSYGDSDVAVFSGNYADYRITYNASNGLTRVADGRAGSPDGTDTLSTTEQLEFADGTVDLRNGALTFTPASRLSLASLGPVTVDEGDATGFLAHTLTASEAVLYTLAGVDAGLFEINATTGVIAFLQAADFERPQDADHDNVYEFSVVASVGGRSAVVGANVIVQDLGVLEFTGTAGADSFDGRDQGEDLIIDLGAGNDYSIGGSGSDLIRGGAGDDFFDCVSSGRDTLIGGDGNDHFRYDSGSEAFEAVELTIDAGAGNDFSTIRSRNSGFNASVDMGAGSDTVHLSLWHIDALTVDLGDGDDNLTVEYASGPESEISVTLGQGRDTVTLGSGHNALVITDFETGAGGDLLELTFSAPTKWAGIVDPFAAGFARVVQDGDNSLLQIRDHLLSTVWDTTVTFENTLASDFTSENFDWSGITSSTALAEPASLNTLSAVVHSAGLAAMAQGWLNLSDSHYGDADSLLGTLGDRIELGHELVRLDAATGFEPAGEAIADWIGSHEYSVPVEVPGFWNEAGLLEVLSEDGPQAGRSSAAELRLMDAVHIWIDEASLPLHHDVTALGPIIEEMPEGWS